MLSLVSLVGTVAIALRRVVFWEWTPLLLASGLLALVTSWCCNPVLSGLQWGQTALLLQLLVVADLLVVSRHGRGVFVGVASAIKLFPALFLVVFALRRDWRPLRLALIAAGVMTAASTLIWPRSSWYFLIHVLLSGQEVSHFDTTSNLVNDTSIAALFNRPPFFHGSEPHTLRFVLCAAVVVWGLALAQRAWRRGFEVTAVVTVLVVDAVGLPNAWIHYYAFVPLLFVTAFEWRAGPQRTLLLAEAIGLCFPFVYFRTAAGSGPLHNVLFQLICDADALLLLGYLVLASWHLVTSKPMANRRRTSSRGERNDRWTPPRR